MCALGQGTPCIFRAYYYAEDVGFLLRLQSSIRSVRMQNGEPSYETHTAEARGQVLEPEPAFDARPSWRG